MKTSSSVIQGIEDRLRRIQDDPRYFSERAMILEEDLRKEADFHSFWLEHPELRQKLLLENNARTEKDVREIARKGVKRIRNAWNYLSSHQLKESQVGVLGFLNPEVVSQVGKYVDPDKNSTGFRVDMVSSPFPYYTPKSHTLVPGMIESMCNYVKNRDHDHPVEMAAEVHMRIAGIQPFKEGNKRSARLMERRVLDAYGLPTSFIPLGERQVYLDLLTEALKGLESYKDAPQTPFFDYIGGKVTVALDRIIDDLRI